MISSARVTSEELGWVASCLASGVCAGETTRDRPPGRIAKQNTAGRLHSPSCVAGLHCEKRANLPLGIMPFTV